MFVYGLDSGYYYGDHWYATSIPTIFTEARGLPNSDAENRGTRGGTGEIFSFRIYDRKLTAEEVAYNYTRDAARFLGKGFPTSASRTLLAARTAGLVVTIW